MLKQLTITNFALIDTLSIELTSGFNVLTGETGAGKSIIVDAISILTGSRASNDFIREGQDKAVIEGFIELDNNDLITKISDLGFQCEDRCISLTREISKSGKNICRINGRLVPLSLYQQVGKEIVDIHGQNQEQSLLSPMKQLNLLDSFGGSQLLKQKKIVAEKYTLITEINRKLNEITGNNEDKGTRAEILNYQIQEIEQAALNPDDESILLQERTILSNAEKLSTGTDQIYSWLFAGGIDNGSVYDLLSQCVKELEHIVNIDPGLLEVKNSVENLLYQLEDYAREVKLYNENIEYDSQRLEGIEQRLDLIKQLKRKYGGSIEAVLKHLDLIKEQKLKLEQSTEMLNSLNIELREAEEQYQKECIKLRALRKETASLLEETISNALKELELLNSNFVIELTELDKAQNNGLDYVEFLFSPNPGEGLKPLAKTASGGEISRVMLAFKSVLAELDAIPTMIFDEIDTGVGGKAVMSLGLKLANLARTRQVISVTHSPQVASFADTHFYIYKEVMDKRTRTKIDTLETEDRVLELARMMGGAEHLESVKEHAKEMLNFAFQEKCV